MASPSVKSGLTATPPTFSVKGPHNSLLLEMTGLGQRPAAGRLLRGLTPYLDEQGAAHVFLLTERKRREPWGSDPERLVSYQEVVHWERGPQGGIYRGACAKGGVLKREEILQAFKLEPLSLVDWAARCMEAAVIRNDAPILLAPCFIPKPWGREVWYTGIEKRGVSLARSATGTTELPYALGMFPVPLIGEQEVPPILLKALEPFAEPVYGDLYLEVHREKWEVYVVLEVSPAAWPEGEGVLRAGLDPEVVEGYRARHGAKWERAIAGALEAALHDYEQVRRDIDRRLDAALTEREFDPDRPVPPALRRELQADLPPPLKQAEAEKRAAVERFLGKAPLRQGDVVTLPPGILHSLQHGIRVIEFQTPTYERLIAMFSQKVLTQPHWDSSEAVKVMQKAPYEPPEPLVLAGEEGVRVERVVDFPQFQVERARLEHNRTRAGSTPGLNGYRLLIGTGGTGEIRLPGGETFPLESGQAYLLPATLGEFATHALTGEGLTYLQASPTQEAEPPPEPGELSVDDALERSW